jgi:hypothetical protein
MKSAGFQKPGYRPPILFWILGAHRGGHEDLYLLRYNTMLAGKSTELYSVVSQKIESFFIDKTDNKYKNIFNNI